MEADGLALEDVERLVLAGTIVERQRDRHTGEAKYVVEGRTVEQTRARVVARIGATGRLVIITVYCCDGE